MERDFHQQLEHSRKKSLWRCIISPLPIRGPCNGLRASQRLILYQHQYLVPEHSLRSGPPPHLVSLPAASPRLQKKDLSARNSQATLVALCLDLTGRSRWTMSSVAYSYPP